MDKHLCVGLRCQGGDGYEQGLYIFLAAASDASICSGGRDSLEQFGIRVVMQHFAHRAVLQQVVGQHADIRVNVRAATGT